MSDLSDGIAYFVVFLLSTTFHEASHAWVAKRGGDLTAYHGGQVTLDPIPHIRREPFGLIILPLITTFLTHWPIGFASAPYDPEWARRYPKRAAIMALAGPAANLTLVLLSALAIRVGAMTGVFHPPPSISFGHIVGVQEGGWMAGVALVLGAFFSVNLLLFAFNLLPLPPLDGSGAVPLFLGPRATRTYQDFMWGNRGLAFLGILLAWKVFDYVFEPLFVGAVSLLYGVTYG